MTEEQALAFSFTGENNGLKETLLWFREEALKKRGLTDTDLTA